MLEELCCWAWHETKEAKLSELVSLGLVLSAN